MTDFVVRSPNTSDEFEAYYDLRWRILRAPLGMELGTEKDDKEDGAFHVAVFDGQSIVGVGRLHLNSNIEGQIRYMAIEPKFQGRGIGSLIINTLEDEACRRLLKKIVLDARDSAPIFYEKNGYKVTESFTHSLGINCKKMEKFI